MSRQTTIGIIIGVIIASSILIGTFALSAPQNRGSVVRDITPEADSTYYLGTTTRKWLGMHFVNATGTNTLDVTNLTADNITGTSITGVSEFVADYLTAGSIVYVGANGGLTQNNGDLYYDYTNNRVGIGTNAPTTKLEVSSGTTTMELLDVSNYRIKNLADPVDDNDAINKAYYDAGFTGGVSWQDSVLDILDFTTSEPAAPTVGDRYITNATGTMSVTSQYGYSQHIYTWDTTNWATTTPVDKMGVKNVADGNLYVFNDDDWAWNSIGSSWAHSVLLDVKGSTEQYHISFNQYSNMFVKGTDDTDDLDEGSTNLFYTDARVDTRVQGGNYTVTGDWVFSNPVSVDDAVDDLDAVNFQTMTSYLQGFTWKDPVIDKDLSTPPVSPTLGDRYIVAGSASNWYDTDWSSRQDLSLGSTDVSAVQTNYPVLIKLTAATNTVFSTAQADGDDILFTDEDGTKLKHEIESYNATDELLAWVKVPYLSSTSTSNIYMYYGNAGSGSQQEVADTWDSDFEMVYHMEEASGSADDSTGVYDGSNTGVTYSATGKIGKAYDFNGTSAYTDTSYTTSLSASDFTIEGWFEADTTSEVYGIAQSHTASPYASDFIFYYNSGSTLWWMRSKLLAEPGGFTATDWNHVVMVWDVDTATYEGFVNGVSAGTSAVVTGYGGVNSIKLATRGDAVSSFWDGIMDEVRISAVERSDDYITTTYNITSDPDTFVTFGAEETLTASGAWGGHINSIMEWDSVNWNNATPTAGWATIVTDEDKQYLFDGSNWIIASGSLGAHNDTTGIQGGTTNEYYHWNSADYTETTGWLDDVVLSDGGAMDIGAGDFTTTGNVTSTDVNAGGAVTGSQIIATGAGSWPSVPMIGMYILNPTTARILPYHNGAYIDLLIGDYNSGDANITLKAGGKVGINEGTPLTKLHVNGDGYFKGEANTEQLTVRGHTTQTDYTLVVEQSDGTDVFTVNNDGKATTTSHINVGGYASSTSGLYTQGDGHIGGDLTIDGNATSTNLYASSGLGLNSEYINQWSDLANYSINPFDQWLDSTSSPTFNSVTTTDSLYVGGNANFTGLMKTSNAVAIEQQTLQSFWPFKYEDNLGAGANTGLYFDITSGLQMKLGGTVLSNLGGLTGDITATDDLVATDDVQLGGIITVSGNEAKAHTLGVDGYDASLAMGGGTFSFTEATDQFGFDKSILIDTGENLFFRDTNVSASSTSSGVLDIGATARINLETPEINVPYGYINVGNSGFPSGLGYFYNDDLDTDSVYTGLTSLIQKTAGASDSNDSYIANQASVILDQSNGIVGNLYSRIDQTQIIDGTAKNAYGLWNLINLDTGSTTDDVEHFLDIDVESAMTDIGGDINGLRIQVDDDDGNAGTVTMLKLDELTGVDYGIYQNGTADNYLGGDLKVTKLNATSTAIDNLKVFENATTSGYLTAGTSDGKFNFTAGDINSRGTIYTSEGLEVNSTVAIEQQSLQGFWVAKYNDSVGAGANTGLYFNVLGGGINFEVSDINIWSISTGGTSATYGYASDYTMNFTPSGTNAGSYKWMEDENYFEFEDNVTITGSATTSDRLYVGNQLSVNTSTPWSNTALAVNGNSVFDGNSTTTGIFAVNNSGNTTSTMQLGDVGTKGCIKMRDSDDGGWSYLTVLNGAGTFSATACD